MESNRIFKADCLDFCKTLGGETVSIILTSPPYNKSRSSSYSEESLATMQGYYKDFDDNKTNEEYIAWTIDRFVEFERILKDDGVIAYNMSYATDENKMSELMWLVVAEIFKKTNLTLADCIVWKKRNATPNNVSPNKLTRICEFIFIFCKRKSFDTFYANKQVLSISGKGQKIYENQYNIINADNNDGPCAIHKATYSTSMCFKVLSLYGRKGGVVYDPFMGTGTTAMAAIEYGMDYIGTEISQEYIEYANKRISQRLAEPTLF